MVASGADDQLTVIAAGVTVHEALQARAELEDEGISIRVIDLYGVKPLATDALEEKVRRRTAAS